MKCRIVGTDLPIHYHIMVQVGIDIGGGEDHWSPQRSPCWHIPWKLPPVQICIPIFILHRYPQILFSQSRCPFWGTVQNTDMVIMAVAMLNPKDMVHWLENS
jgi:hypothetical protein